VPQDQDEITDVYDAREGGGFPPSPAPVCPSEADCRAGSPPAGLVPSATSGSGSEAPPPPLNLESKTDTTTKPLTRAQKLAKALRACKKVRAEKKQKRCELTADHRYGPKQKPKKKTLNHKGAK
jgi:hypothetical protein